MFVLQTAKGESVSNEELERKAKELQKRYDKITKEIEDIAAYLGKKQDDAKETLDELMACEHELIKAMTGRD